MNKTKIEWVKNPDGTQGYTWNPITGCLNHTNGLCKGGNFPCYAYKLAHGRLRKRYKENPCIPVQGNSLEEAVARTDPFYPRFWRDRLIEPYSLRKPSGIFPCDMSDLFGVGVPEAWTEEVLAVIKTAKEHRFYPLTKQPQNLPRFSPFPENCWVGVTVTNNDLLQKAAYLTSVNATVKFLSIEPLLERLETSIIGSPSLPVNWLIIGALTGTYAEMFDTSRRLYGGAPMRITKLGGAKYALQPKIEWIQEIIEAADAASIPVFLKDNLRPLLQGKLSNFLGQQWATYNNDLRQEFPKPK